MLSWHNEETLDNVLKITGAKDKLLPSRNKNESAEVIMVPNGEHFMVVDRGKELSAIINEKINSL